MVLVQPVVWGAPLALAEEAKTHLAWMVKTDPAKHFILKNSTLAIVENAIILLWNEKSGI